MSVAVCVTVKNEAADAAALVESLLAQTLTPDEIVIVDGGSRDGTQERLQRALAGRPNAAVIEAPGSNIAAGRNAAVAACTADLIAITDAGLTRPAGWLAALVQALDSHPLAAGAYGFVLAAPRTTFEAALGAVALPAPGEIDQASYPPSSGSVLMRRDWLKRAGGYPEWLDHGEDLWLDRQVWSRGGWFVHAPGAGVRIRPRSSIGEFYRQYFNYARGDGRGRMLLGRHAIRFCTYLAAAALLRRPSPWRMTAVALMGAVYLRRPFARLPLMLARAPASQPLRAAALLPLLRAVGDLAKMAGFVDGLRRSGRR